MRRTIRVAIIATLIHICLGDKRTEVLKCSRIVMEIAMNNCKEPRIKREAPRIDLAQLDRELSKVAGVDESQASDHATDTKQEKRQFLPEFMPGMRPGYGGYGPPGLEVDSDHFQETELSLPGLTFENEKSDMFHESIRPPGSFYPMGYRSAGAITAVRSPETGDLLGFELSSEDLKEFYDELADRMPRKSKDYDKIMFFNNVVKCCQNLKACREDPKQIPCMGF